MIDAQENHEGLISRGSKIITNFRFADDINCLEADENEQESLVESLEKPSYAYGIVITAKKTKIMTNCNNWIKKHFKAEGKKKLETDNSFKKFGVNISERSKLEVLAWIAQSTAALTKLKIIWQTKNISSGSKIKFMHSLCTPVNPGPSPLTSRDPLNPLRWDATIRSCTFLTDITLEMRRPEKE